MVARRSGKIVNIGSISGIVSTPFASCYCATKAALHAFSDSLRMELKPFGIDVMVVAPGGVKSNFATKSSGGAVLPEGSLYSPVKEGVQKRAETSQAGAIPTAAFAKDTVTAILAKKYLPYFFKGNLSFLLPFLKRWLPHWLLDRILSGNYHLDRLERLLK
jgi:short-subunit dehydrogenase